MIKSNTKPGGAAGRTPPPLSIPAKARLTREISLLNNDPPPGVAAYLPSSSDMSHIRAQISGPPGSPFEGGVFLVTLHVTQRYPFEPPRCRFNTPIYHPNIDSAGRICLDTLKSPPAGSWSPAVSLPSLLLSLRSLMSEPNPDDGLVPEISELHKRSPRKWREEASRRTKKDATTDHLVRLERELDGLPEETEEEASQGKSPQDPPGGNKDDESEQSKRNCKVPNTSSPNKKIKTSR